MTNSSKYDELQAYHQNLLKQYEAGSPSEELINNIQDYVKRVREEAELVSDPQDREQLRANLSFWASIIYDATGTYPNTTLRPFNKLRIELAKIEQAIAAQEALRGVLSDVQLEAVLISLRQKQSELQARLSGTGVIIQQGAGDVVASVIGSNAGRDIISGDIVTGHQYTVITRYLDETQLAQARQRYLRTLIRAHNTLPLAALGNEESADNKVRLENIYVALDTTTQISPNDKEKERFGLYRDENHLLSVLEAATQNKRLVILGDPGSGKSTFVRYLATALASAYLEERPLSEGWKPGLWPILMNLRNLTQHLSGFNPRSLSASERNRELTKVFEAQWRSDLWALGAADLADELLNSIAKGEVVLIFDGLDEVPEDLRPYVSQGIQAITKAFPAIERILITSRIRSYVGQSILHGFPTCTLAPFNYDKIQAFVTAWYRTQADLGYLTLAQAEARARNLEYAVHSSRLRELASNPMLLTTMVLLHQWEGVLPAERVRMYSHSIDILLLRWQRSKGDTITTSPALDEVLRDSFKLNQILDRLGYEAQNQQIEKGSDLARFDILALLELPSYLGSIGLAAEFLDYIEYRTGLLIARGSDGRSQTYSFIHRTFQEYLAGRYLISGRRISRMYWGHLEQGQYWQLSARLGAEELFFNQRRVIELLDLAYDLCPVSEPRNETSWRAILWSGQMAALVGKSIIEEDHENPDGGIAYFGRLIFRLAEILTQNRLPPTERVEAGRVLALLGDPRPGVGLLSDGLPDIVWCQVPAGPFLMGSDPRQDSQAHDDEQPMHQVEVPAFLISRYPITNAQFHAFVESGGYQLPEYWTEKGWEIAQSQESRYQSGDVYDLPNHPVVTVNWYETIAFCRWLTEKLQGSGKLAQEQIITLPGEIQWEKAARGIDGRLYPWGNEIDSDRLNYQDTSIGTTNAVGSFPGGVSPYGCEDMSGNIWEWTQDVYRKYPYNVSDRQEDLQSDDEAPRVIRGGAFLNSENEVRCAARFYSSPDMIKNYIGFRIVLSTNSNI